MTGHQYFLLTDSFDIWLPFLSLNLILFFYFPEPYTVREARIHVRHIRDLLKSVDPADAYAGVDCNSVSFLNIVTAGDILGKL